MRRLLPAISIVVLLLGVMITPVRAALSDWQVSGLSYAVADSLADWGPGSAGLDPEPGSVMLDGVPRAGWTYGCSATSAGMLFGYYDRHGYDNMWAGGEVPLWMDDDHELIANSAHITDYWITSGSSGPDRYQTNGWAEHTWAGCTADFMGTSQWKWDTNYPGDGVVDSNNDGWTTFWYWSDGQKSSVDEQGEGDVLETVSKHLPTYTGWQHYTDGTYGLELFAESRGYTVEDCYTQLTDNQNANGFTFADYMSEINADNPVILQVSGHTMLGVGYHAEDSTVYLHDTWGDYLAEMTWGGSYQSMGMWGVSVIHLGAPPNDPAVPELPVPALIALALVSLGVVRFRFRRK